MVELVVGFIIAFAVMSVFWGFIILMSGVLIESRTGIVVGAAMTFVPLIAGFVYVGVAL